MPINFLESQRRFQTDRQEKQKRQQGIQDLIIKAAIKKKFEGPQKWVPTTMEEALEYDRRSALMEAGIETPSRKDQISDLLGIMGGVRSPEATYGKGAVEQVSPLGVGRAGGGRVLTPPGAMIRRPTGETPSIVSPQGKRIGEFAPGYEPRQIPGTEAVPALMRGRFDIGKEEAKRKYLGLPKREEPKEKKTTQAERKVIGNIRALKKANATIEDINEMIGLEGYDPTNEIFARELEGYIPTQRKGFGRFFR